jgi:hypothetical protein
MDKRRDWAILLVGLIVGAIAASLYWQSNQNHRQFMFSHNLKCQEIAKHLETDSDYHTGVLKVNYSPSRKFLRC